MQNISFKLLLFLPFLFLQCKDDDDGHLLPSCPSCGTCIEDGEEGVLTNDCKSNWECTYSLHPNSKLDFTEGTSVDVAKVVSGDKLVFEAIFKTEGGANTVDDELTEFLYFEIDPSNDSFSLDDADLALLKARYLRYCFCSDLKLKQPVSGCMQGQRIDDTHYRAQANIVMDYDFGAIELKMDAVFETL